MCNKRKVTAFVLLTQQNHVSGRKFMKQMFKIRHLIGFFLKKKTKNKNKNKNQTDLALSDFTFTKNLEN